LHGAPPTHPSHLHHDIHSSANRSRASSWEGPPISCNDYVICNPRSALTVFLHPLHNPDSPRSLIPLPLVGRAGVGGLTSPRCKHSKAPTPPRPSRQMQRPNPKKKPLSGACGRGRGPSRSDGRVRARKAAKEFPGRLSAVRPAPIAEAQYLASTVRLCAK
jgi:hypothetical protein